MSLLPKSTFLTTTVVFIIVRFVLAGLALPHITDKQVNHVMGH